MKNRRKNKKRWVILLAVLNICAISVLGYVVWDRFFDDENIIVSDTKSKIAQQTTVPAESSDSPMESDDAITANPPAETAEVNSKSTESTKKKSGTLKKLLQNAMLPVGKTLYVYGGGWNEEDTGAGEAAVTIGVSPKWELFYSTQGADYNSSEYRYQIEKGLDCSGYVGWVLYNTLETENGNPGYVYKAEEYADIYSAMGFGTKSNAGTFSDYQPGDILSSKEDTHVWISLGQCSDGSVILVNSSPPGVRICGTPAADGSENSEAVKVAEQFMSEQFPDWYAKFPDCKKGMNYLINYDRFRWDLSGNSVLTDPEGYSELTGEEVLTDLFMG